MPSEAFKAAVERYGDARVAFGSTFGMHDYWQAKAELEDAKAALLAKGPGEVKAWLKTWYHGEDQRSRVDKFPGAEPWMIGFKEQPLYALEPATPPDWTAHDGNSVDIEKLIQGVGDSIADVIEQMLKGNWIDDHDHAVMNNVAMLNLKKSLEDMGQFREKFMDYTPFAHRRLK